MISNAVRLLHIDELVCLSNCIRIACDHLERDETRIRHQTGVRYSSAEALRAYVSAELRKRPEYLDEVEPWVESPSVSDMSLEVIARLSTKELVCFSNCIKVTLECYEDEGDFHTYVGKTTLFAKVFKTALEMELAKRRGRPAV